MNLLKYFKKKKVQIPKKYLSEIKIGDTILSRTDGIYGKAMRVLKGYRFTHAMLVIDKTPYGDIVLLESDIQHDVRSVLLGNKSGEIYLLPLKKPLNQFEIDKLGLFYHAVVDKKYEDLEGLVSLAFNQKMKEDLDTLFCSELIAHYYETIGRAAMINCSEIVPDDLLYHEGISKIFEPVVRLV